MRKATSGAQKKNALEININQDMRQDAAGSSWSQDQCTTLGDPVRLRSKRLSGGRQSLYFDIYWAGKRSYHFLKLYLLPETDAEARTYNAMMLKTAYLLKAQKLLALMGGDLGGVRETGGRSLWFGSDSACGSEAGVAFDAGTGAGAAFGEGSACGAGTGSERGPERGPLSGAGSPFGAMPVSGAGTHHKGNHEQNPVKLNDWMAAYQQRQERKGRVGTWQIAHTADLLVRYKGADVTLAAVDKAFCIGFAEFLLHGYKTKCGKFIGRVTASNYFGRLNSALNAAVRSGLLAENPMGKLDECDRLRATARRRNYLTIDEVKRLINTDCPHPVVKQAFLFSCFCGLRLGDIYGLKWRDFVEEQGRWRIDLVMRKTQEPLYLPVSEQARRWLPDGGDTKLIAGAASGAAGASGPAAVSDSAAVSRAVLGAAAVSMAASGRATVSDSAAFDADAFVFKLPSCVYINVVLKRWAQAAGIRKNLHFHCARHTFATMMLTLGADLYTTSKLLGHTDIGTTQIYAQIINPKKDAAVDLANAVFGG